MSRSSLFKYYITVAYSLFVKPEKVDESLSGINAASYIEKKKSEPLNCDM